MMSLYSIISKVYYMGDPQYIVANMIDRKECDCPLQNDWLVSYEMISYFLTVDAFETSCHIISYFWFPPCSHYSSYHLHCSDAGRGNYQVFAFLNLVTFSRSTVYLIIVVQFIFFLLFYSTFIWSSVNIRNFLFKKNRH